MPSAPQKDVTVPAKFTRRYLAAMARLKLAEDSSSSPEELAAANEELAAAKLALFRSDEPHPSYSCHGSIPCWREVDGRIVCAFDQGKPEGGTLVGPPGVLATPRANFARYLVYRTPDGAETVVPNGPHNQPIEWRVEYLRSQAEGCRERAAFYRAQPPNTTTE